MELPKVELTLHDFELLIVEDFVLECEPLDVQLPDLTTGLPTLDVELPALEAVELPTV